jgi:hypothetical protein
MALVWVGESHTHVLVLAVVLLAGFSSLMLWISLNLPCLVNPTYSTKVLLLARRC